jgi:hypothetical protein
MTSLGEDGKTIRVLKLYARISCVGRSAAMRQQPMAAFVAAQYTAAGSLRMQDQIGSIALDHGGVLQRAGRQTLGLLHLGQSCIFDPDRRMLAMTTVLASRLGLARPAGLGGREWLYRAPRADAVAHPRA